MRNKRLFIRFLGASLLLVYLNLQCSAQAELRQIVAPSPNAWIFQKFTDMPVSYYNGLPTVDVPIYTIDLGNYKYPLSLSYHSGGIRAEDKASWVGLNWAFNGVGMISRTTLDGADDGATGLFNNNYDPASIRAQITPGTPNDQLDFYWQQIRCANTDLQPDMYYLNAAGLSVKFYMTKQKEVVQINKTDNKIVPIFQGNPASELYGTLKAFIVTGADGTKYYFGNGFDEKMNIDQGEGSCSGRYRYYRSAWFLNKLITAKHDTIRFEYEADTTKYSTRPTSTITIGPEATGWRVNTDPEDLCASKPPESVSVQEHTIFSYRLKTISFDQGKVELYSSSRLDTDAGNKKLDSIKVFNYLNTMISGAKLHYDYYTDVSDNDQPIPDPLLWDTFKRLRLLSVTMFNNQSQLPPYKFDYTSSTLPTKVSRKIDHWGFYNGSQNETYMPYFLPPVPLAYADKSSPFMTQSKAYRMSTDSMARGTLYKVTYPTGGYTQFSFEPNEAFMRNFLHHVGFIGFPHLEDQYYNPTYPNTSGDFLLQEINAIPDTAATAQTITLTSASNTYQLNISSNCGYRYFNMTGFNSPDYNGSNFTVKVDIAGAPGGNRSYFYKSPSDLDDYYYVLPDGQYTIHLLLLDGENPVSINDPVTATIEIKADILDFCQEKNRKVGGLRVNQIISHDPVVGQTIQKEFRYAAAQNPNQSSGSLTNKPIYFNTYRDGTVVDDPLRLYFCGYVDFSEKSQIGDSRTGGSVVGYNHVTELYAVNGSQGKITYDYLSPKEVPDDHTYTDAYPFPPTPSHEWERGLLVKKSVYRYDNSFYQLIQQDSSIYSSNADYNNHGLRTDGAAIGLNAWANGPYAASFPLGSTPVSACILNLQEYHIPYGAVRLSENVHTEYDPINNNKITQIQKYFYDNPLHEQPMRIETYDSRGSLVKTENKYPYDYAGTAVYDTMVARNIINPTIEQIKTNVTLNKELSRTITNYGFWQGVSQVDPTAIQTSINGNAPETRLLFNAYNANGNILEQQKEKDLKHSYLWGYKNTYPIAEVMNAANKDIFHTSFEDTEGNSADGDSKTGKKSKTGDYSKLLSGLTNTDYVLSYWLKSGSAWIPQSSKIKVTTGSYTISLSGQIDEVRFYPAAARMTTYTYDPLVGITSVTDANGLVTYYEYDDLGRLKSIRDDDKNVIKAHTYHYANEND